MSVEKQAGPWYAWYPVRINTGERVWLRRLWRSPHYLSDRVVWMYAPI